MRLLPIAALVLVSLTFTVGGVAIVGRADSTADSSAQSMQTPAATPAEPAEQKQCATPKPFDGHLKTVHVAAGDTVPLNTHGYNYSYPGDIQMDPSGRAKPSETPPKSDVPPAAPAKP